MPRRKGIPLKQALQKARQFVQEAPANAAGTSPLVHRLRQLMQIIDLVTRGFIENRCPARAAALSYTTLLALIPLLVVGLSVSKNFLHDASTELVPRMLDRFVAVLVPQLEHMPLPDEVDGPPAPGQTVVSPHARQEVVARIQSFISNIDAGTLGVIGSALLVAIAIRLLMSVERTFNDIWCVRKGRSIWRKIAYYWSVVTLGPLLLLLAMYLTGRAEFARVSGAFAFVPGFERFLLRLAPFVALWIAFSLLYALVPNTHVRPRAAIIGGIVGGTLWQLNSLLSTLYVSRVVAYSKIYGALGILPVLLVGIYFAWLIVLLGAQVAYTVQNARVHLQRRLIESIDQEGREAIACRIVLMACRHFLRALKPPNIEDLADTTGAPPQLLNQLVQRLIDGGILSELANDEGGLQPGRPPEMITVADVLHVVRSRDGTCGEPPGRDGGEPVAKLLGEIYAAERNAPANARFSDLVEKLG
jgi:membrane protein